MVNSTQECKQAPQMQQSQADWEKTMQNPDYSKATFMLSVANLAQLPADEGYEVAFVGRSNAGKSSALNTITNLKGLARTSKTPGRTQCINLFQLDETRRLVDLPGYGYAKVPLSIKERWQKTTNLYLQKRDCLRGLVLLMDIRHPLKDHDQRLINWCVECQVPLHILLTKCDKISNGEAHSTLLKIQHVIQPYAEQMSAQLFSSLNRTGLDQARAQLDAWFCN